MKSSPETRRARRRWYWLLFVPYVALLVPQIYASGGPPLFGIPFFYWYQMSGSITAAVVTGIVYFATRESDG
jgi:hypothetical protein